jgi:alanine racemase
MTQVMSVREVAAGTTIGYGARSQAIKPIILATIAIGYGDGYPRSVPDGTKILIKNKICELIGRISMDMTTINLMHNTAVRCGDIAALWGENLPIEYIFKATNGSPYDIIKNVQLRVKFSWT